MEVLAKRISGSELEVMRVLWDSGEPLTITDIRRALRDKKDWESTTVKTLVQRLRTKGVLRQENAKPFMYRALVSEQEYNDWATGDLIQKLYRGSARELVAALVKSESLSERDVEELRSYFSVEDER